MKMAGKSRGPISVSDWCLMKIPQYFFYHFSMQMEPINKKKLPIKTDILVSSRSQCQGHEKYANAENKFCALMKV